MKRRKVFSKKLIVGIIVASLILFSLNLETEIATSPNSSYQIIKTNDQVVEKPFSFDLTPHEPIEIDSDSDFTTYDFPGSGTEIDPYIIENYEIRSSSDKGISIKDTTRYFVIRDCYVDAGSYGIYIENVANGTTTIINNTCTKNIHGIKVTDSSGATLTNNTCSNNNWGIWLSSYMYVSSGATLTNNTCNNNTYKGIWLSSNTSGATLTNNTCTNNNHGIYLEYHSLGATLTNNTCNNNNHGIYLHSDGSSFTNNTCNNNNNWGIYLDYSDGSSLTNNTCNNNNWGIYLDYSDGSSLTNNTCTNNNHGIYLYSSDSCLIIFNLLQENGNYGIYLSYYSDYNIIYHNIFAFNNLGGTSQAYDYRLTNTWYNTSTNKGNWWSDWSGSGAYSIGGSAGVSDPYPILYEDTDSDGLVDILEIYVYHTNPSLNDTDGDDLSDGEEVKIYKTDPNDTDTDSDGLEDGDEVHTHNTNPNKSDTDNDGLTDGDEVHTYGTDPNNVDSDGDEYSDFEEVLAGKDPLNHRSHPLSRTEKLTYLMFLPILASVAILAFVVPKYAIPYTKKTIIPYFRKRKAEIPVSNDEVTLIRCSGCGNKAIKSLNFCPFCGITLEE